MKVIDARLDPPVHGEPVKCLVVDDVEQNLVALKALLEVGDVQVLTARSGPQALELLLEHEVALALLDVQMPDMNGFELAELIRGSERTRHVPLIFMTAGARDQMRLFKGYESGAVDFLYKPIDARVLTNKADVFFDLHRQKRQLAHELRERTEALQMNEMFIAVLSHDLRTPLAAILAGAKLLQRGPDAMAVAAVADRLAASGRRMSSMIEDLLDVARARLAGGVALKPVDTDLLEVLNGVVQEQQAGSDPSRIRLQHQGDLRGHWDPERLFQAAANLVGNALQHGAAAGAVEVTLDGRSAAEVVFSVANEGRIDPLLLPHIFDPFRGREPDGGRHQGLGLGLFIVRQIVIAHRGAIDVHCDAARTVFTVRLPR